MQCLREYAYSMTFFMNNILYHFHIVEGHVFFFCTLQILMNVERIQITALRDVATLLVVTSATVRMDILLTLICTHAMVIQWPLLPFYIAGFIISHKCIHTMQILMNVWMTITHVQLMPPALTQLEVITALAILDTKELVTIAQVSCRNL